jgi:hypothetical protein
LQSCKTIKRANRMKGPVMMPATLQLEIIVAPI